MEAAMHAMHRRAAEDHNEVPRVPRADASIGTFSESNFGLGPCSPCSHSSSESSSGLISSSTNSIRLPISRREDFLLGPDDLTFGSLEPDHLGYSPALVGLTNHGESRFQSIIPVLLPPLEDADIRPPDHPSDLITPTPKTFHDRTGYFGQEALEKLRQKRPVKSVRGSTASTSQLSLSGARWKAPHDVAAQHAAVVDHPGNVKAIGPPACVVSPKPRYPNNLSFAIPPSFTTRDYSEVPNSNLHERLLALQLPSGPSPRLRTPKLAASDSPSPSNGSELLTPSTRYHTPASLPSPILPTSNPPSYPVARPSPMPSPVPNSRSLSSASRSASRCSSNSSSKSSLRSESHPRLGTVPVAPRIKRGRPPPVPAIPDKYRRERSVERWLRLPGNEGEAEGRRGSGGSLGTLRQAKSMENLSHIGYKMEDKAAEKVETINEKHASRPLSRLGDPIPNTTYEPSLFNDRNSADMGECSSPDGPALHDGMTTLAPSLPRSRSPSVLVHGPVLHVDETFEEGRNWLLLKSFQSQSEEIQIEKTPNWFERSRTPSPLRAVSPYLPAVHSPARGAGPKANGPGALVKKWSGSFVKVSRGLRHVTSSSGLGIMIGQESEPSRSSRSTRGSKHCLDESPTLHEAASLSSSSENVRFSGRSDSWRGQNGGRYRGSKWSARDPVVRSLESEPSVGDGDRVGVRLVDFLNESRTTSRATSLANFSERTWE